MENLNMTYNSQLENLTIPEYGRNVQELVKHCKTIENKEMRQAVAEEIVALMGRMSAPSKMTNEYNLKLWKHFLIISEYEIEVDLPEGVDKSPENQGLNPDKPDYPVHIKAFRHYGQIVQSMVAKAQKMEDGPLKDQYVRIIGSYMKLAYRTWNSEHYVSDEIIKEDLASMTNGDIKIDDSVQLNFHNNINNPLANHSQHTKRKRNHKSNNRGGRNNYRQKRRR